jgi:hypothetical protein
MNVTITDTHGTTALSNLNVSVATFATFLATVYVVATVKRNMLYKVQFVRFSNYKSATEKSLV